MLFLSSPHYPVDFVIQGPGYLGLVGLRRSHKIRATLAEIDHQFARVIAGIRTCPSGGPVSRELWLYSRYGALRFIRVTETGIEEIDRQVILCRQDVPAEAAESTAVPVNPTGPEQAASLDGDEDKKLLRWLAKRCPEIRGEPGTAGPALPAGESSHSPVTARPGELPAPGNNPAINVNDREIPGKPPALAAGSGLSGKNPTHETAGAAVWEFPEKNPADPAGISSGKITGHEMAGAIVSPSSGKISGNIPAGEKSGTKPENETGRLDDPGKFSQEGAIGTGLREPAPENQDSVPVAILTDRVRESSPTVNEEVS